MTAVDINLRDVDFKGDSVGDDSTLQVFGQAETLIQESVSFWRDNGLLRRNDSHCFAVLVKVLRGERALGELQSELDNPEALFDFAYLSDGSDDGEAERYAANALRKMRATVRTGVDTLVLARSVDEMFVNRVGDTDTASELPWGEFPYGGAVLVDNGKQGAAKVQVVVGVSAFTQEEDDWLAELVAKFCQLKFAEQDEDTDE
jgi:hypothetical protein